VRERRTFIVRVHPPDDRPIVEDVATGELVRLPDLASIPDELRRRLYGSDGAMGLHSKSWTPPKVPP
jgi:hypothetical protein